MKGAFKLSTLLAQHASSGRPWDVLSRFHMSIAGLLEPVHRMGLAQQANQRTSLKALFVLGNPSRLWMKITFMLLTSLAGGSPLGAPAMGVCGCSLSLLPPASFRAASRV